MKTSIDLPDDLYRLVKSKSALEGLAVREVATALFSTWVTLITLDRELLERGVAVAAIQTPSDWMANNLALKAYSREKDAR